MKPGWQTSEFWLSALALAMPLVTMLQAVPNPWIALPAAAIAGAYSLSRGSVKKADSFAAAHVAASIPSQQQESLLPTFGAMTAAEKTAAAALETAKAAQAAASAAALK